MNPIHLVTRKIIGLVSQVVCRGYSHCHCCGIAWPWTENHSTPLTQGTGMFPLCEWCWSHLTPDERVPFYLDLYTEWCWEAHEYNMAMDVTKEEVIAAVYREANG